jgi:multidrug efflux pump subunit AcrB
MWIVSFALRRPLSIAVMALLMLVLGVLSYTRMNADIFPAIDLPVVIEIWAYPGLSAVDMERRVTIIAERVTASVVNDIEHIESMSIAGAGVIKIYFHPGATLASGIAQMSSTSETLLSIFPPGMQAPNIVDYNAANVPVVQLNISSETLSEQQVFDYGLNFIRLRLFVIEGISTPAPFGGRNRAIMVNLNPTQMYANGLSAQDIGQALNSTNVIIPAGSIKVGNREYRVELNGSVDQVNKFNDLPVKVVNGTPVFLGQVAPVTDTHQVQTNIVRVDGKRATYLPIYKHAAASTLTVVDQVKGMLPSIMETAPKGMKIQLGFDQSVFVRGALIGVVREAAIAAGLVALMVLIFLGCAQHADRHPVDSAFDPDGGDRAQALGRFAQYHDARRTRARGRDAGRRRDSCDREYPSSSLDAEAFAGGDPGRGWRDRDAGPHRDTLDLHRVLPGRAVLRRGALPVYTASRSRGLRDADLVCIVAHAGAGDGALPNAGRPRGACGKRPLGGVRARL